MEKKKSSNKIITVFGFNFLSAFISHVFCSWLLLELLLCLNDQRIFRAVSLINHIFKIITEFSIVQASLEGLWCDLSSIMEVQLILVLDFLQCVTVMNSSVPSTFCYYISSLLLLYSFNQSRSVFIASVLLLSYLHEHFCPARNKAWVSYAHPIHYLSYNTIFLYYCYAFMWSWYIPECGQSGFFYLVVKGLLNFSWFTIYHNIFIILKSNKFYYPNVAIGLSQLWVLLLNIVL